MPQGNKAAEARARELYDSGQWAQAAEFARNASPQTPSLFLYRGLALARLDRFAEASSILADGFRQYPNDTRLAVESAGVAYRRERPGEAKHWLRRALRIDASDAYANEFLGTLFLLEGNLPATLKYLNRVQKPLLRDVTFGTPARLDAVLRARIFPVSGGQVFSLRRYDQANANLARLDVFARTVFDLDVNKTGGATLDIRNEPLSLPFGGWAGRLLPALRGLPYQALMPGFYNIDGRALNATSLLRWDSDKRRILLRLAFPWRENPRIETGWWIDLHDESWDLRRPNLAVALNAVPVRTLQTGAQVAFGLTEKLQWTVGLRVAVRRYPSATTSSNPNGFFRAGWSAEIDNRFDYALWRWPEQRAQVQGWSALRAGRFSTSRLVGVEAGVNGDWYPQAGGDRYRVAAGFAISRLWGNAPLDELYIAGMERDNPDRYWLRGHPGARYGQKGSAPLGQEIEAGRIEAYRKVFSFPFVRAYLGPWFDFGRTAVGGPFSSNGWLYDTGAEARVSTLGGVNVRFIYGRDLRTGRNVFYTAISR